MVRTAVDTMSNRRFIIVDLVFTAEGVDRTERDARTVLFPRRGATPKPRPPTWLRDETYKC